jgi:hypothetical protein
MAATGGTSNLEPNLEPNREPGTRNPERGTFL